MKGVQNKTNIIPFEFNTIKSNSSKLQTLSMYFLNIISNGKVGYSNKRSCSSDHNGTKFFKIGQKLTEIWHFKNIILKDCIHFPI